ncbi:TlpA disulfide reductase family protein [Parabacteroides sp. PFB2-10]|uniref:TlpA family protein disulfide reductase n=1 Tax=Parabacteroides sp. PFB2-10 TaxID=1742405 RepID=UPI0024758BC3|nr:TlpA disulfide reductase family protein [Parabacteroides sp. PFB2-10]MDL2244025.1 TlpA family protein disulfide reductase [Parabacteroides sp. OttesenSCG-928-J18]
MKAYVLTLCLFLATVMAKAQTSEQDIVKVGDAMPSFTISLDDGKKINSNIYAGKVVLINFFATWCPPCQKELAEVQATLWPKYQNNKDFILLTIGREHSVADLLTYNEKKGFTFPLYPDKDRSIYGAFAKSLIPRTYLIDKKGKVVMATVGFNQEDYQNLLAKIEELLK